jgi:aminocarboxymuconate-semialdehyde decarboxylase
MQTSPAIDVHGHAVPHALIDEIQRHGDRLYGGLSVQSTDAGPLVTIPSRGRLRPVAARLLDFETRIAWLDERGIDRQLVSPWLDIQGYELEPTPAAAWARAMNEAMVVACGTSAGRLTPLGTLPFGDTAATVRELERCARDLAMPGVMVSTQPGAMDLHAPALDDFWAAAEQLQTLVVLHPSTTGPASHMPGTTEFTDLFWRGIDTMLAATRLILAGVFDRFPKLRIVLVHGGGFLPYQTARLDRSYAIDALGPRTLKRAAPSAYLGSFFHDTCMLGPAALILLCQVAGADRVVLGSDYPFPIGDPDPVGSVAAAGLDDQTTRRILHDTAAGLLASRA